MVRARLKRAAADALRERDRPIGMANGQIRKQVVDKVPDHHHA